ncbi:MAG: sigma-70 family RNA polymerase sigma factor [Planctomycetes bacterium]|nr:sigma-70 family RNA polymerase sigma factor [Planctomycetota bacterium]
MDSLKREGARALPEQLVAAACERDPDAWQELVERVSLRLAARLRLPSELARRFDDEDVLQATLLRAWERIESFEYRGEGSFIAWMQQILLNVLRDDIRHHGRAIRDASREEPRQLHRLAPEQPEPSQRAAQEEESLLLDAAIGELPVLEQRLVRLRLRDGHSWREIADRTGRSRRALRRTLDEAMRRLADAVA